MEIFVFGAKKAFKIAKNDQKPDFKKLKQGNSLALTGKKKVCLLLSPGASASILRGRYQCCN